jgi:hypothetical protein
MYLTNNVTILSGKFSSVSFFRHYPARKEQHRIKSFSPHNRSYASPIHTYTYIINILDTLDRVGLKAITFLRTHRSLNIRFGQRRRKTH